MKKTQINIKNVPPDLLEKAQEIARQQDRPLSLVIRDLLREYVAENSQKLQPTK